MKYRVSIPEQLQGVPREDPARLRATPLLHSGPPATNQLWLISSLTLLDTTTRYCIDILYTVHPSSP
jgi:hypothetical protein